MSCGAKHEWPNCDRRVSREGRSNSSSIATLLIVVDMAAALTTAAHRLEEGEGEAVENVAGEGIGEEDGEAR